MSGSSFSIDYNHLFDPLNWPYHIIFEYFL